MVLFVFSVSYPTRRSPSKFQMNRGNCHKFLTKCTTLKRLQQVHAQSITQSLHPHLQPLSCSILNLYVKLERPTLALRVSAQIPSPDLITLTSLINLHIQINEPNESLSLFADLIASGQEPDGYAVVGALSASGRMPQLRTGKSVHGLIYRHELYIETFVNNALIDMYCRNGRVDLARMVFDKMLVRDSVSWSTMLHGHVMCDGLDFARQVFDAMPQRSVVAWTVMITGYVQGARPVRALELFRLMKLEGHHPTLITIVTLLSACADIGASYIGRAIHGCISKMNLAIHGCISTVYNALIDMYVKSGDLPMAYEIFKGIVYRNIYTWTTVISGFALHGEGRQAIEVFYNMLESGVKPNEVTFLAVLSACSHSGLVDEGKFWFKEMSRVYKLKPDIKHYGCMVDLLGRAGHLKEAEKLIKEMNAHADFVIWRSLLSACLVHGDRELAETALREIIKQEPVDDVAYVLMWNMYASSNRWEEAMEMREKMREKKVVKRPGCSWIEIDGLVHEFSVHDREHSLHTDIYLILEELAMQLKMHSDAYLEESDLFDG